MRRDTCNSSASLNAAGAVRSTLSRKSVTSAVFLAGLVPDPEKMTSSMPDARMFLYELSPITQRNASTRFDLPQPFGPTMPVSPRSMTNSPGSTKDLNPRRRRRENFMHAYPRASRNPLARLRVQASEHAVDDRRHFRNRQGPFVGVPVDEEGRGGVHLELVRPPFLHRSHIVQKLLVRQAGLEGLL